MIIGVILAAGEGKRMALSGTSKTAIVFEEKPLISYGIDLFRECTDKTYIVVGAHSESVKAIGGNSPEIRYVEQTERKGTGHAVIVALEQIKRDNLKPEMILVGYGDHMMFYTPQILEDLVDLHAKNQAVVSLISTVYEDPDFLSWGRIIRDESGKLINIIEQNDATPEQRKIQESNAGFYCLDFEFASSSIETILKAKTAGEYYVNDFTYLALRQNKKVSVLQVPFSQVGIGINTREQFMESSKFYKDAKAVAGINNG